MLKRIFQVSISVLIIVIVFSISSMRVQPPPAQAQCVSWGIWSNTTNADPCPALWTRNQPWGNAVSPNYGTRWYIAICAR